MHCLRNRKGILLHHLPPIAMRVAQDYALAVAQLDVVDAQALA